MIFILSNRTWIRWGFFYLVEFYVCFFPTIESSIWLRCSKVIGCCNHPSYGWAVNKIFTINKSFPNKKIREYHTFPSRFTSSHHSKSMTIINPNSGTHVPWENTNRSYLKKKVVTFLQSQRVKNNTITFFSFQGMIHKMIIDSFNYPFLKENLFHNSIHIHPNRSHNVSHNRI